MIYDKKFNSKFITLYTYIGDIKRNDKVKYEKLCRRYPQIQSFSNMRNTLSHYGHNGEPPFIVSDETIEDLKQLIGIISTDISELWVKLNDIAKVTPETTLREVITLMSEKNYSFLPIIDEKYCVIGVVSEKSVLSLLKTHNQDINVFKIKSFLKYFSLDANPNEYYPFINSKLTASEAKEIITTERNGKRASILFVTKNGSENEPLLGLLTAWDLFKF